MGFEAFQDFGLKGKPSKLDCHGARKEKKGIGYQIKLASIETA